MGEKTRCLMWQVRRIRLVRTEESVLQGWKAGAQDPSFGGHRHKTFVASRHLQLRRRLPMSDDSRLAKDLLMEAIGIL